MGSKKSKPKRTLFVANTSLSKETAPAMKPDAESACNDYIVRQEFIVYGYLRHITNNSHHYNYDDIICIITPPPKTAFSSSRSSTKLMVDIDFPLEFIPVA